MVRAAAPRGWERPAGGVPACVVGGQPDLYAVAENPGRYGVGLDKVPVERGASLGEGGDVGDPGLCVLASRTGGRVGAGPLMGDDLGGITEPFPVVVGCLSEAGDVLDSRQHEALTDWFITTLERFRPATQEIKARLVAEESAAARQPSVE